MKDKISSIAMLVLIILGIILFIMSITGNVDPILYGSYVYFGIGLVVAIIGGAIGLIANPSSIKGMAIGIVGMLVVLGIAYGMADGSDASSYPVGITEGMSRFSGMLLYAIYILFGASIVTLVFARVYSLMR
ncbi:hypothetical protein KFE94_05305 [bacterium SCSIO 12643]|nr:hypothetical protein KFE94_05305 [bacterium SCSIO 12643]